MIWEHPEAGHERLAFEDQLGADEEAALRRTRRRLAERVTEARGHRDGPRLAEVPADQQVIIAGKVISAQRPTTAKGMGFLVIEDETGRVQVACLPPVADTLRLVLAESPYVAISGRVERTRWHRSLLGRLVRPLPHPAPETNGRGQHAEARNRHGVRGHALVGSNPQGRVLHCGAGGSVGTV